MSAQLLFFFFFFLNTPDLTPSVKGQQEDHQGNDISLSFDFY